MKYILSLFLLFFSSLLYSNDETAISSIASIEEESDPVQDEYLTGYVQALIDAFYCEYKVRVVVKQRVGYVCNLPDNPMVAEAILCFVRDLPQMRCVVKVTCNDEHLYSYLNINSNENCKEYEHLCDLDSPFSALGGVWFDQTRVLFTPFLADPRQAKNSAMLRFGDKVIGHKTGAVSFGDVFPFYRKKYPFQLPGDLQFDIEAGIFAVFNLIEFDNSFVNCDYFVSGNISYGLDRCVWRFRLSHLSAHLGDEFLLSHPGFVRKNLSDNTVDLFCSYQLNRITRIYGGAGYIFFRDVSFDGGRVYFDGGAEIKFCRFYEPRYRIYTQPYFAVHLHACEDNQWGIDRTYAFGFEWSGIQGSGRKFRFYGECHKGFSREGQFIRDRSNYTSFGLSYGM